MHLTPHELDKLALHQAGYLAQKRLARGVRLNYPEAVALISTQVMELIRDGRSVAELMDLGRQLLGRADVMEHVPEMIVEVQVEGTFPDGSKLVTVHHPIAAEHGDIDLALYGSFLPAPPKRGLTPVRARGSDPTCTDIAKRQRSEPRWSFDLSSAHVLCLALAIQDRHVARRRCDCLEEPRIAPVRGLMIRDGSDEIVPGRENGEVVVPVFRCPDALYASGIEPAAVPRLWIGWKDDHQCIRIRCPGRSLDGAAQPRPLI